MKKTSVSFTHSFSNWSMQTMHVCSKFVICECMKKKKKNPEDASEDKVAETVGPFFVLSSLHQYIRKPRDDESQERTKLSQSRQTNKSRDGLCDYLPEKLSFHLKANYKTLQTFWNKIHSFERIAVLYSQEWRSVERLNCMSLLANPPNLSLVKKWLL